MDKNDRPVEAIKISSLGIALLLSTCLIILTTAYHHLLYIKYIKLHCTDGVTGHCVTHC